MKYKQLIKQYGFFYLFGCAVIIIIKHHCRYAESDELIWLLAPTAWWVQAISGAVFRYQPSVGYVSHGLRFIIAPSCSGVQFMLIHIAVLLFSFIHRMRTGKGGLFWLLFSIVGSYVFTIFVNSLRIVLSIYLPLSIPVLTDLVTPETLHSVIGIVVYFSSLLVGYQCADRISQRLANTTFLQMMSPLPAFDSCQIPPKRSTGRFFPPVFWYFLMVLGIPFLNRVYRKDFDGFLGYSLLVILVCAGVLILFYSGYIFLTEFHQKHQNKT